MSSDPRPSSAPLTALSDHVSDFVKSPHQLHRDSGADRFMRTHCQHEFLFTPVHSKSRTITARFLSTAQLPSYRRYCWDAPEFFLKHSQQKPVRLTCRHEGKPYPGKVADPRPTINIPSALSETFGRFTIVRSAGAHNTSRRLAVHRPHLQFCYVMFFIPSNNSGKGFYKEAHELTTRENPCLMPV